MFSVNYLFKSSYWGEIHLIDLFWLELLQTYDKKVYDTLAKDKYSLLMNKKSDYVYELHPLNNNRYWKEKTKEILTIIFPVASLDKLNTTLPSLTLSRFTSKECLLTIFDTILNKQAIIHTANKTFFHNLASIFFSLQPLLLQLLLYLLFLKKSIQLSTFM